MGSAVLASFDAIAGDSSRASPPGASFFSAARVANEDRFGSTADFGPFRTHGVDWIERVETFRDAEGLGRVAMTVTIGLEEVEPGARPCARPIQRERAARSWYAASVLTLHAGRV